MPSKMLKKYSFGFTLIELLVTITIVSLLFGVVLASTNALRSTSADAKRKADLAQLQSALQNYYADQGYYPRSTGTGALNVTASGSASLTSTVGLPSPTPSSISTKTYLKQIPKDSNAPYCYIALKDGGNSPTDCDNSPGSKCHYYLLGAKLDNPTPAMTPPPGVTVCSGATINYFVTP